MKLENLAPAGNREALDRAVAAGADAVYLGYAAFSARAGAGNFDEEQLREAAKSAVCKINIDSDSRLAMTAAIREVFATHPAEFDPRKYLGPARENMKKQYIHKIKEVLGSDGKAE